MQLLDGWTGYPGAATGRLVVINEPGGYPDRDNLEQARQRLRAGDILVTPTINIGWTSLLHELAGLVVERGGMTSHPAILAREHRFPAVVGARDACRRLAGSDGQACTFDALNRAVFPGGREVIFGAPDALTWREAAAADERQRQEPFHWRDSRGHPYVKKPVHALDALQLGLYVKAMERAASLFPELPLEMSIRDRALYVRYDQWLRFADTMFDQGLPWLEEWFEQRLQSVERFRAALDRAEPTTTALRLVFDAYVDMLKHFHLRASFRRGAVMRMRDELLGRLPDGLRGRVFRVLAQLAPLAVTETQRRDHACARLIADLPTADRERLLLDDEDWLRESPEPWPRRAREFLRNYKLERFQIDDWRAPLPVRLLAVKLKAELAEGRDLGPLSPITVRPETALVHELAAMEGEVLSAVPGFPLGYLVRVVLLSEKQAAEVDRERHQQQRHQSALVEVLRRAGERLAQAGWLASAEAIFTLTPQQALDRLDGLEQGHSSAVRNWTIDEGPASTTVGTIELHPTNRCNLACPGCTYLAHHCKGEVLPMEIVERVAALQPGTIYITGGGEPSLYRDRAAPLGTAGIPELVAAIRRKLPAVTLILGTNGVSLLPLGAWQQDVDMLRVGLHGFDHRNFASGSPTQAVRAWDHFWRYFRGPVGQLWMTLQVDRSNYPEALELSRLVFARWSVECQADPALVHKEIGLKMLYTADDTQPADPFHTSEPTEHDQSEWSTLCAVARRSETPFGRFLREMADGHLVSNLRLPPEVIQGRLVEHVVSPANHCRMAGGYVLVGADGKYYPCCSMLSRKEFDLGPSDQSPDVLLARRQALWADPLASCRQGCRLENTLLGQLVREASGLGRASGTPQCTGEVAARSHPRSP